MSPMSDLVKDARLPTRTHSEYTIHTFLESTSAEGRRARRREREEHWERKQHLGIGICGTVWLEECVANGDSKLRAVKEVRKVAPGSRPMDYSRELEAIVKFSQQRFDGCFVKSSGWFENTESVFIPMEYIPLGDLQKYMVQPFAEDETQLITLQLLEGLDFMHSHGFAHRDLKPQHVFVLSTGPTWWVKIGDFGISKCVIEALTGVQTLNGTPAFIAPEVYQRIWGSDQESQAASESDFTPEVDIWSLGVITYYMLTGKLPFLAKNDLLAYYKGEASLPLEAVDQHQAAPEASTFLEQTLAPAPGQRISARDALEHAWLIPLLEDSEPDDTNQRESAVIGQAIGSPLRIQTSRSTSDVMLPGTIDLSPLPITPITMDLSFPVPPTRFGIGDSCQQAANTGHPAFTATSDHSGTDSASITHSQYGGSQNSEPTLRMHHSRQMSSMNTSSLDPLPPYSHRRSDDAPIPASDLDLHTSTSRNSGSSGSTKRHHTGRFSGRLRHFSSSLVQKRSGRLQGQGTIHQQREKQAPSNKERVRSIDLPTSPLSSNSSTESTFKPQVVDTSERPQYGEHLPMFPMRPRKN